MTFADIRGHERLKSVLRRSLERGRLPQSMLFSGPDGVGKKTLALTLARGFQCARGTGDPCEECNTCCRIQRGVHPDVQVVLPEGNAIKVDRVRDLIREINALPFEARARFFIVDQAHVFTEEAANALLKGLEEPPRTTHIVLVTASPQALLATIRSRCQILRFSALPRTAVAGYLEQTLGVPAEEARLRAQMADGSLGAAITFESGNYRELREALIDILERIDTMTAVERLESAQRISEGDNAEMAFTVLRSLIRDVEVLRGGEEKLLLNADAGDRLRRLVNRRMARRAISIVERIGGLRAAWRGNANRLMIMDLLVATLAGDDSLHETDPA